MASGFDIKRVSFTVLNGERERGSSGVVCAVRTCLRIETHSRDHLEEQAAAAQAVARAVAMTPGQAIDEKRALAAVSLAMFSLATKGLARV